MPRHPTKNLHRESIVSLLCCCCCCCCVYKRRLIFLLLSHSSIVFYMIFVQKSMLVSGLDCLACTLSLWPRSIAQPRPHGTRDNARPGVQARKTFCRCQFMGICIWSFAYSDLWCCRGCSEPIYRAAAQIVADNLFLCPCLCNLLLHAQRRRGLSSIINVRVNNKFVCYGNMLYNECYS